MWINLSFKELTLLQESLNVVTKEAGAKLWAKIQRRKESDKKIQKEKEKLNKIFQERAKELEDENKTKNSR